MELLDVAAVAEMLDMGQRTVWRFRDTGRMPAPLVLGRCIRWRRDVIEAWIKSGVPDVRRTGWQPAADCEKGGCRHA